MLLFFVCLSFFFFSLMWLSTASFHLFYPPLTVTRFLSSSPPSKFIFLFFFTAFLFLEFLFLQGSAFPLCLSGLGSSVVRHTLASQQILLVALLCLLSWPREHFAFVTPDPKHNRFAGFFLPGKSWLIFFPGGFVFPAPTPLPCHRHRVCHS